jgi:hypothetical protein
MSHLAHIALCRIDDFVVCGLHGKYHVCAGVAIWNRKNVQGVHHLLIRSQPVQACFGQSLQHLAINREELITPRG